MRYQFIDDHRDRYPLGVMVSTLEVSPSGYHAWRRRPVSPRQQRRETLTEHVRETFQANDGNYGSRKIVKELVEAKVQVCRNTVAKIMREENLRSRTQRRRFVGTTDSTHDHPIAPNHLDRDFQASGPNQKWLADITYMPMETGWAYVAAVMDLYSRRIVGWAVSDSLETTLVADALDRALLTRRPDRQTLTHHSDRGCQYASDRYRRVLAANEITCSMSRRGNCWDNAPMERFMNSLKNEWTNHHAYRSVEEVHRSVFKYIELFYNRRRRHQALGYISPVEYEQRNQKVNVA